MSIESVLQHFISTEVTQDGNSQVDISEPLIESGRIDSMGLLQIFGFVEQTYPIDMMTAGGPNDFLSVASMASLIRRVCGDKQNE